MRAILQQQPQLIPVLLQQLAQREPALAQLIAQNPEALAELLAGGGSVTVASTREQTSGIGTVLSGGS